MAYSSNILEEELKNKVARDWFAAFDTTPIVGKIDFSVAVKAEGTLFADTEFLLWAEAKQGTHHDIYESFVQLILTIGKARTFDTHLPPAFLGAFDAEKIAFIPYNAVMHLFAENDFNWNVPPSNHDTREFRQVLDLVKTTLEENTLLFRYDTDANELKAFIRSNFRLDKKTVTAISINKNNFTHIYLKWLREVKPSIAINWEEAKKEGIIDADFYLADVLSENNLSLKEKLFVLLKSDKYFYNITRRATGSFQYETINFNDGQKAHARFWLRYARPPKQEYWDYIVNRRDLLVPQDVRERKGSFFTPAQWVELSQEYIARELGEDWQDEYYIWDCAAGTGNLLAGLTNKFNIYASTLDKQDVKVMHDLIAGNRLNLLESHVFQFDFLNGSFDQLPASLRDIINDENKRRKLVIYINPPYAEATSATTIAGTGTNKSGVSINNQTNSKYKKEIGKAANELFALFLIRIYKEIGDCIIANFATLKVLTGQNFNAFRNVFKAQLSSLFIVPANTFDNVIGQFPIGFYIWRTEDKAVFDSINADVYERDGSYIGTKQFKNPKELLSINQWWIRFKGKGDAIGLMVNIPADFQHNSQLAILSKKQARYCLEINAGNLISRVVYFAVRHCIEHTWIIHNDQFFAPNDSWQDDVEFQTDCLAFTLFHGKNRISIKDGGVNHWIPFTEEEAGARERFASHFMSDFIRGKARQERGQAGLFADEAAAQPSGPIAFSEEARAVLAAGLNLWRYYHAQPGADPNAAFYDIRLFFQGVNDKGKMKPDSDDEHYTALITALRRALRALARKIEPKIYAHAFLLA